MLYCIKALPSTTVESPTLATMIWSCLKITMEAVVPAVLKSPVLDLFQVANGRRMSVHSDQSIIRMDSVMLFQKKI